MKHCSKKYGKMQQEIIVATFYKTNLTVTIHVNSNYLISIADFDCLSYVLHMWALRGIVSSVRRNLFLISEFKVIFFKFCVLTHTQSICRAMYSRPDLDLHMSICRKPSRKKLGYSEVKCACSATRRLPGKNYNYIMSLLARGCIYQGQERFSS